ncbi:MAG: cation:proton antiporter [Clostridiales bacterium]|nr:cation:proton antiporter [Clostridiales bacterium]
MGQTQSILLLLSITLLSGLLLSRLAKKLQLPAVTAYLIAGVLIGPYALGQLSNLIGVKGLGFTAIPNGNGGFTSEFLASFAILSDVALGFIAFSIGNEFRVSQLKKIGKQATIVGILQAVVTTLVVDAVLIVMHLLMPDVLPLEAAIILGAIASATAPAATLMVVKQYKAKGPVTDILLPVVALDDAVGLILFAVSFGVARGVYSGSVDVVSIVVNPLIEIIGSLTLGALMGYLFSFCERFFHSRSKRLAVSVAFVLLTIGLSKLKFEIGSVHIGFSSLLTCMMLGTIFCNVCDFSEELMDRVDRWTAPLFIVFFVTSGAELDLSVFSNILIVLVGVAYIISRSAGKYTGALLSSKLAKCDDNIVKYLGITLLPQAGVALGMADIVKGSVEFSGTSIAQIVVSITLFAVLIYELVGPALTKMALTKAGDINPEGKTSARHEHAKKKAAQAAAAAAQAATVTTVTSTEQENNA